MEICQLKSLAEQKEIWLWDFDGYNHERLGMTLDDVMDNPKLKMGHAFVLKMMLVGHI